MKDVRCLFGRHKFSEWIEVGSHIERECLRCCKVEAKYPNPVVMLTKIGCDLLWKFYLWNTSPKRFIPRGIPSIKREREE